MTQSKSQKTSRGKKQTARTDVKQKYLSMATWNPKNQRGAGKR